MDIRWDHASLAVSDIDAGIAFFGEAFGFGVAFLERGMGDQIASMLGLPDATCDLVQLDLPGGGPRLELIAFRTGSEGGPPARPVSPGTGHLALRVADFDATVAKACALGARPVGAVTRFSDGRSVYLATPFGAFLELEELAPGGPAA